MKLSIIFLLKDMRYNYAIAYDFVYNIVRLLQSHLTKILFQFKKFQRLVLELLII